MNPINSISTTEILKNKTFQDTFIIQFFCTTCRTKHRHGIDKQDFGRVIHRVAHHPHDIKEILIQVPKNPKILS